MLVLTKKELKLCQDATTSYICGKISLEKFDKDKNYQKIRDHCYFTGKYRDAVHITWSLRFNVPNEIPVFFHNEPNYDYHFKIKN